MITSCGLMITYPSVRQAHSLCLCHVSGTYYFLSPQLQWLGWAYILFLTMLAASAGTAAMQAVWITTGEYVAFFQLLALLEIVHPLLGMVRASAPTTALQVVSRLNLVYVANHSALPQNTYWTFAMVFAWSLTEVFRYGFFVTQELKIPNGLVKWCRYSFFIVLYPLGVAGEMGTLFAAWPDVAVYRGANLLLQMLQAATQIGKWLICVVYAMGLPFLYGHMLGQRKKVLGGSKVGGAGVAKKKQ